MRIRYSLIRSNNGPDEAGPDLRLNFSLICSVMGERMGERWRKIDGFSIISQDCRTNLAPDRVEATKSAMATLLKARNLSGTALHLQNRIKSWLSHLSES